MNKPVSVSAHLQPAIDRLQQLKASWNVGLLFGQVCNERVYIVHLAELPKMPEDDIRIQQKKKSQKGLDAISSDWLCDFSEQSLRTLPGGVNVIGLFIRAASSLLKSETNTLIKQLLNNVYKTVGNFNKRTGMLSDRSDSVIMLLPTDSKTITFKHWEVVNPNSMLSSTEWKMQNFIDKFYTLHSKYFFSLKVPLNRTLKMQMHQMVDRLLSNSKLDIANSVVTLDNKPLTGMNTIDTAFGKNKSTAAVNLLAPLSARVDDDDETVFLPDCDVAVCRGGLKGVAYVLNKATLKEAVLAVKTDLLRSLQARFDVLVEATDNQDNTGTTIYNAPKRVFGQSPDSIIAFSDYIFPTESTPDARVHLNGLLGLDLGEEHVDDGAEIFPVPDELEVPEELRSAALSSENCSPEKVAEDDFMPNKELIHLIGIAIAGAVAVVSAGIAYYLIDA